MKPTRSAKRTETSRRSAAGAARAQPRRARRSRRARRRTRRRSVAPAGAGAAGRAAERERAFRSSGRTSRSGRFSAPQLAAGHAPTSASAPTPSRARPTASRRAARRSRGPRRPARLGSPTALAVLQQRRRRVRTERRARGRAPPRPGRTPLSRRRSASRGTGARGPRGAAGARPGGAPRSCASSSSHLVACRRARTRPRAPRRSASFTPRNVVPSSPLRRTPTSAAASASDGLPSAPKHVRLGRPRTGARLRRRRSPRARVAVEPLARTGDAPRAQSTIATATRRAPSMRRHRCPAGSSATRAQRLVPVARVSDQRADRAAEEDPPPRSGRRPCARARAPRSASVDGIARSGRADSWLTARLLNARSAAACRSWASATLERALEQDARLLEPVRCDVRGSTWSSAPAANTSGRRSASASSRASSSAGRGLLVPVAEHEEAAELRGDVGDVLVRLLARERLERRLEPRRRPPADGLRDGRSRAEHGRDPGRPARQALGLEDGERPVEVARASVAARAAPGRPARPARRSSASPSGSSASSAAWAK